jgi:hypothetical protein
VGALTIAFDTIIVGTLPVRPAVYGIYFGPSHSSWGVAGPDRCRCSKSSAEGLRKRESTMQEQYWPRLVVLSTILSFAAILGWWSTEGLYAEQVVYSFDSQGSVAGQK